MQQKPELWIKRTEEWQSEKVTKEFKDEGQIF